MARSELEQNRDTLEKQFEDLKLEVGRVNRFNEREPTKQGRDLHSLDSSSLDQDGVRQVDSSSGDLQPKTHHSYDGTSNLHS
jgi:hypothetical protein